MKIYVMSTQEKIKRVKKSKTFGDRHRFTASDFHIETHSLILGAAHDRRDTSGHTESGGFYRKHAETISVML